MTNGSCPRTLKFKLMHGDFLGICGVHFVLFLSKTSNPIFHLLVKNFLFQVPFTFYNNIGILSVLILFYLDVQLSSRKLVRWLLVTILLSHWIYNNSLLLLLQLSAVLTYEQDLNGSFAIVMTHYPGLHAALNLNKRSLMPACSTVIIAIETQKSIEMLVGMHSSKINVVERLLLSLAVNIFLSDLAFKQPADQVSVDWGGVASRAVDGDKRTYWYSDTCMHTDFANDAWWRVDLAASLPVAEVVIVNRNCFTHDGCAAFMNAFEIRIGKAVFTLL